MKILKLANDKGKIPKLFHKYDAVIVSFILFFEKRFTGIIGNIGKLFALNQV